MNLIIKMKTKKLFEMFYFTCNESRIYESFTFLNKLQKKKTYRELFHDIQFFWDAPVYVLGLHDTPVLR